MAPSRYGQGGGRPRGHLLVRGRLYEMLTGKRPSGARARGDLNAILRRTRQPFDSAATSRRARAHRAPLPRESARRRFRTAHDLAIALDAISTSSTRSLSAEAVEASRGRRRGRLLERLSLVWPAPPWPGRDAGPGARALAGGERAAVFRWMTFSGRDSSPAVSPDGHTCAFTSTATVSPDWLKQVSGEARPAHDRPDDFPRFSPDGTQVLFSADEAGISLYRAAVLGGEAPPARSATEGLVADGSGSPSCAAERGARR